MGVDVWLCRSYGDNLIYGYGKTPHAAYLKWREKVDRA